MSFLKILFNINEKYSSPPASLVNTLTVLVAGWVALFTVPLAATRHRATLDTAARQARDTWTRLRMAAAAPRQRKVTRFAPGVKEK